MTILQFLNMFVVQAANICPKPNDGITSATDSSTSWIGGAMLGAILKWWIPIVIGLGVVGLVGVFGHDNGAKYFKKIGIVIGVVIGVVIILSIGGSVITNIVNSNC